MKSKNFEVEVIEHSKNHSGIELITLQLKYPRFIHAEVMTHRVFSRNASSSRAIPVIKMLKQVWSDPAMPIHWGENIPGMQAKTEVGSIKKFFGKFLWKTLGKAACATVLLLKFLNIHKQVANRLLEPWQFIHVVVTSTEWNNFFELRDHPDAQPEIRQLAILMKAAIENSEPTLRDPKNVYCAEGWHLPYVTREERAEYYHNPILLCKLSTARTARVSYFTHTGKTPQIEQDFRLHDRLVGAVPIHASPTEHAAAACFDDKFYKNFRGWKQYRFTVEEVFS